MASTTVTTTQGNTTTSTTTSNEQPGKAWVKGARGKWVKPAKPKGDFAWNDDTGWVSKETAASAYAYPLAIVQSNSELNRLFNEAWAAQKKGEEWTKEKFTVRLQATNWYKNKSASERAYYTLANDPAQRAEFNNQVNAKKQEIISYAQSTGIKLSTSQIDTLAKDALRLGQTEDQLSSILVSYVNYESTDISKAAGSLFGKAGDAEDAIREWAKRNGVNVSDSYVLNQVRESGKANWDISKAQDAITTMAKRQYSHWANDLDGVTSLDDLAQGFKNTISTEMDIDFSELDMNNQWVKNAMLAKDDKNQPINQEALRKTLRKTDDWANVSKNKEKIYGLANDILSKFGMR
jgi:hypothetical protein